MILAVTHRGDGHARSVLAALARLGVQAERLDFAALPREGRTLLEFGGGRRRLLRLPCGRSVDAEQVGAVWWRRPRMPRAPRHLTRTRAVFAEGQTLQLVLGWLACLRERALLVNDPWAEDTADLKMFQLGSAERAGLRVPRTLATSAPGVARAFVRAQGQGGVVHKAVHSTVGEWRRTARVDGRGLPRSLGLPHAPALFQERIPGVDVRVTVVGDQVFAAEIDARRSPSPDDYRGFERYCRFAACRLPGGVERGLRRLMKDLGLLYGAADFRRTDAGEWFFLEVNPSGQWGFVEERTGQPITAALAALLARGERRSRRRRVR